jgi:hypothetical protein
VLRKRQTPPLTHRIFKGDTMITISARRLRHPALLGFAIALTASAIAACSGTNSAPTSVNALPARMRSPLSGSKPSPTPYKFSFKTLNDPASTTFNVVMGIDQLGQIVGYYGSGKTSNPSRGYSSLEPYTKFHELNYPSAINTVPAGLSDTRIEAGYFLDSSKGGHTWGFMKVKGIWSQFKDPKTPKGPGSVNELLGVNDAAIAVGYYTDAYGHDKPYELAEDSFHTLNVPGAVSATANAINQRGDIAGTETLASGATIGWLLRSGSYSQFSYKHATSTQVTGINFQEQVVGFYVDSDGTHGFILTNPQSPNQQYWQAIDEPDAAGTTVIEDMNNHHTICGYYIDSDGNTDGFIGTLQ